MMHTRSSRFALAATLALGLMLSASGFSAAPLRAPPFLAPKVTLRPAAKLQFHSNTDSNSPSFWVGNEFHLINSNQNPSIASGPDIENLGPAKRAEFVDGLKIPRWIEGVYRDDRGVLWGLYHREDYREACEGRPYFTIPRVGIARSDDTGRSWHDLGVILSDDDDDEGCETTPNVFFAGGVGDPSWAIDRKDGYAYILYSSYSKDVAQQGVQVARLALRDLGAPVGKAHRWTGEEWAGKGVGGRGEPVFPPQGSWHGDDADAFWGPSIHWNTYVGAHVVFLNRTRGPFFEQEGAYVFYAPDLKNPRGWTQPEKFYDGGDWYVQVVGDSAMRGTDTLAGQSARLFMHGTSNHRIHFEAAASAGAR